MGPNGGSVAMDSGIFPGCQSIMWSGLRCAFPRDLVEKVVIQPDGPHSVQSVERSSSDAEQRKHKYEETKLYCGSGMFIQIPDPNFFPPGSRFRIKEFKY